MQRTANRILGFALKNQKSYVVLDFHKNSPILNYTFLESNLE